jgi:hypothetical protein
VAETAVTELGHVGLGASDLSRCRVFAGEVLGMECVVAGENTQTSRCPVQSAPLGARRFLTLQY